MTSHHEAWEHGEHWYEYEAELWLPRRRPTYPEGVTPDSIEAVRNIQLRDTDIITATYPKTGSFQL